MLMNLDKYISKNGPSMLLKALGVAPAVLYQWRKNIRTVPPNKCPLIERLTNGQVTRKDLRPKDWADIWPELIVKCKYCGKAVETDRCTHCGAAEEGE